MKVFIAQLYEHFITDRTSFTQGMFSEEGLGKNSGATGHRWEGNVLALRAWDGYGTIE